MYFTTLKYELSAKTQEFDAIIYRLKFLCINPQPFIAYTIYYAMCCSAAMFPPELHPTGDVSGSAQTR
jgi:hypothetical protein